MTHWSSRLLATHLGVGNATVARPWREVGVQPWRAQSFRFSTDPALVAKVTDIVGLHLAPPQNAIVLCADCGDVPLTGELGRAEPGSAGRIGVGVGL